MRLLGELLHLTDAYAKREAKEDKNFEVNDSD